MKSGTRFHSKPLISSIMRVAWFPALLLIGNAIFILSILDNNYSPEDIHLITITNSTDQNIIARIVQLEPDVILPINETQDFENVAIPPGSTQKLKVACDNKFGKYSLLLLCFDATSKESWDNKPKLRIYKHLDYDPSKIQNAIVELTERDLISNNI